MKIYTKQMLIETLFAIRDRGWIKNENRLGNAGAIGNMLEDLLGIDENNLPIPNASEWELKSSNVRSNALTTLFHVEPSPKTLKLVVTLLLPSYGWGHQEAGTKYAASELSFRQTIRASQKSDRGFKIVVNRQVRRVEVSFDAHSVNRNRHIDWLESVDKRVGLAELNPQPYWGFDDLTYIAGTKLKNMFYIGASRKSDLGFEYFHYNQAMILSGFSGEKFIAMVEAGNIFVDFDARSGHNHGTKFRIRRKLIPELYEERQIIFE